MSHLRSLWPLLLQKASHERFLLSILRPNYRMDRRSVLQPIYRCRASITLIIRYEHNAGTEFELSISLSLMAVQFLYLLIVFLFSLRSNKRSFLMCFLRLFNKKRVVFAKKGCNVTTISKIFCIFVAII